MSDTATAIDLTPIDHEAPPHVPRDRIVDLRAANGLVTNDLADPYLPAARLLEDGVPRVLFYPHGFFGREGGAWAVTHYEDIRFVYESPELFSTQGAAQFQALVGETWPSLPLGVDPPDHARYRRFLNPHFTPATLTRMEPAIRQIVVDMIEAVREKGEVDISYDFGRVYPVRIFLDLMGYPLEMFEQFLAWEYTILHSQDAEQMRGALTEVLAWLRGFIAEVRANPRPGALASDIANGTIAGEPLSDDERIGIIFFLWLGGLDTVASTIGQMFRRLGTDLALQRRLRAEPDLVNSAVEEFLRTQPLVNSRRTLTRDFEWHGVRMKKGDKVMCLNSAGNFDPRQFGDPRNFDPARPANRHFTFTGGVHICLGAHLARRELRVLLEEWFARIPEFRVKPGSDTSVNPGLLSIRNLPLVWNAAG
ncbi:MAG: cytochrome P450 [Novosphingobium sp.]|nr:cytochrome P450 [Novosphingobium sp.]